MIPANAMTASKQAYELVNLIASAEAELAKMKATEQKIKDWKNDLYELMELHQVKSWEMPNGTKLTKVSGTEDHEETKTEVDLEALKRWNRKPMQRTSHTKLQPPRRSRGVRVMCASQFQRSRNEAKSYPGAGREGL